MELDQLRFFYHVARTKRFALAAEELFVTRPAVSIRIRQLEEHYRVRLFERSGRKIELTDAGRMLYGYADRIFQLVDEADNRMQDLNSRFCGTLKISTGLTVGTYYLAPLINAFKKDHPEVDIQMDVKNKRGVIDDILSLRDDLGFLGSPPIPEGLVTVPLWREELVVITPIAHPFGRLTSLSPERLTDQPFILREKGSGTREYIEDWLRSRSRIRIVMEIGSDEAIKHAVSVGLGISIIPLGVARREVQQGLIRICRLDGVAPVLEYCMVHHRDKYLTNLIGAFMKAARTFLPAAGRTDGAATESSGTNGPCAGPASPPRTAAPRGRRR
jgi:DNA-binding transcriptional LysR family regulator